MDDRISTLGQEGRMLITPENGDAPFYALVEMADNPSNPGTPINKATLLKDATAALFGLDASAVPDDALQAIWSLIESTTELAQSRAQIAIGSYAGTDTYGIENKNTLTFSFEPKLVIVMPNANDGYHGGTAFIAGQTQNHGFDADGNTGLTLVVAWSGKSLSWYTTSTDTSLVRRPAMKQLNAAGVTYFYCAFA